MLPIFFSFFFFFQDCLAILREMLSCIGRTRTKEEQASLAVLMCLARPRGKAKCCGDESEPYTRYLTLSPIELGPACILPSATRDIPGSFKRSALYVYRKRVLRVLCRIIRAGDGRVTDEPGANYLLCAP